MDLRKIRFFVVHFFFSRGDDKCGFRADGNFGLLPIEIQPSQTVASSNSRHSINSFQLP